MEHSHYTSTQLITINLYMSHLKYEWLETKQKNSLQTEEDCF